MAQPKTTYTIRCMWVNDNAFYWELEKSTETELFFGILTKTSSTKNKYSDLDYAIDMARKDSKDKITTIIIDKSNL